MIAADDARHGTMAGYAKKCRCDRCAAAEFEYGRRRRANRRAGIAAGTVTIPHGTANGYSNYECRCEACCAHASDPVAKRLARVAAGELAIPHGTSRGYTAFNCRCGPCCAARKVTRRAERLAAASRAEQVAA